jgi:hypothetical protein
MVKEEWGPDDVAKLLDKAVEKIPTLLKGLREAVYSAEAGEQFGKAVGAFYGELIKQGIPHEQALEMAKNYMISLRDLAKPSLTLGDKKKDNEES